MKKTDKPGIYRQRPAPPPPNRPDLPSGSWITVFRLSEMTAEDIDRYNLRKYLRDEGEGNDK
ncbi:hypothetical protein M3557_04335 [Bhargavaea ginsengi]|uniref:hypothetical protein n=1 Tax=Bhargavaea ginsengi TaxID=426757 RepID=UPI0020416695|nr:hypothetical protein [Bhargavaea ginsengi]MCM3087136.1 hypothetical protein [Bhargavaea ginsengi]